MGTHNFGFRFVVKKWILLFISCSKCDDVGNAQSQKARWQGDRGCPGGRRQVRQDTEW